LTHNVHGPHDEKFYALLKSLETDYSALRRGGYSGEGFYSEGRRLGVGHSHNAPSLTEARRKALAAAEKRRSLSAGSGQRLGGASSSSSSSNSTQNGYLSIREKVAAATERRIRDTQTCGAGSAAGDRVKMEKEAEETIRDGAKTSGQEVSQAEEDENEEAIIRAAIELIEQAEREEAAQRVLWEERGGSIYILDDDDEPIIIPPSPATPTFADSSANKRTYSSPEAEGSMAKRPAMEYDENDLPPSYEEAVGEPTMWECEMCTLLNHIDLLRCEVCSFQRSDDNDIPIAIDSPRRPSPREERVGMTARAGVSRGEGRERQRVRFVEQPTMIGGRKGKENSMWQCHNCTFANEERWWCCEACGVMKLSS
jgi:DNA-dependent metalloprotease WSS1